MAATTTVRDVLWRTCTLLQDVSPQYMRWSERELVSWLNDAQMAIVKFIPTTCTKILSIRLKPGTRQSIERILAADVKGEDGAAPSSDVLGNQLIEVVRNMGADGMTPGVPVPVVLRETLNTEAPLWHSTSALPVLGYCYSPQTPRSFLVYPGVPAGRAWVEVAVTTQPTKIPNTGSPGGSELYSFSGNNATLVSIDDEHADDLVNYVVARAHMKQATQASAAVAAQFSALFTGSINAKVAAITGNNPNLQILPFAAEPIGVAQ